MEAGEEATEDEEEDGPSVGQDPGGAILKDHWSCARNSDDWLVDPVESKRR